MGLFGTVRSHWKKSAFLTVACVYGARYGQIKLKEKALMRSYCKEAQTYGEPGVPAGFVPYHVTVILNPAANGGKGRARFESYCAPLLHLAGIKVSVISTEGEGQAKDIMEVVTDCNAVLVAGGDGTLMEAVTGLLRRSDIRLPLGILPIGRENRMAKRLFPAAMMDTPSSLRDVALMAEATMAVVRQLYTRPLDVIEVENLSDDFKGKKIYGLRHLQVGAYRDSEARLQRYWYLPGLKHYLGHVLAYTTAAKHILWSVPSSLQFFSPVSRHAAEEPASASWWRWLLGSPTPVADSVQDPELVLSYEQEYSGPEMVVQSANDFDLDDQPNKQVSLKLTLAPEKLPDFFEFVAEAWRRRRDHPILRLPQSWPTLDFHTMQWSPRFAGEQKRHFNLDNEQVDVSGTLKVSLLRERVVMFCSRHTFYPHSTNSQPQNGSTTKWWRSQRRFLGSRS